MIMSRLVFPLRKRGLEHRLVVSGNRLDSLEPLLTVSLPPWGPYEMTGVIRVQPDGYSLSEAAVSIGDSRFLGQLYIGTAAARPKVTANLEATTMQLADFGRKASAPGQGRPAATGRQPGRSADSEDLSRLRQLLDPSSASPVDADVSVSVSEVLAGTNRLGSGNLRMTREANRISVSPLALSIPGGDVNGTVDLRRIDDPHLRLDQCSRAPDHLRASSAGHVHAEDLAALCADDHLAHARRRPVLDGIATRDGQRFLQVRATEPSGCQVGRENRPVTADDESSPHQPAPPLRFHQQVIEAQRVLEIPDQEGTGETEKQHCEQGRGHGPQGVAPLQQAEQRVLEDVVDLLEMSGGGSLQIFSDAPVHASSRTYNTDGQGTFGQFIDSTPPDTTAGLEDVVWLQQLQQNQGFRTNIGIVNSGATEATVKLRLFDEHGERIGQTTRTLAPYTRLQLQEPFSRIGGRNDIDAGYATISVEVGDGIIAYGSVIDNVTNDPTTVPMAF